MRYNHYFIAQGREKYAVQKYYELPGSKSANVWIARDFVRWPVHTGVSIHALLAVAHNNLSLRIV